jgi:GST-like protein
MIDLYYWPTPNGWKVSIMLEECGLQYRIVPVNIGAGDQFKPGFLKISPSNRMPAIIDNDVEGAPIAIFESGAIMEYLAEKTGKFMPADQRGKYEVLQWVYWQMSSLGPMMGQASHFINYAHQITDDDLSYPKERYGAEARRLMKVMNTRLAGQQYLAGNYSIADMISWPWIKPLEAFGFDLADYPHLVRWRDEVGARPAVERGYRAGEELRVKNRELSDEAKDNLFGKKQAAG